MFFSLLLYFFFTAFALISSIYVIYAKNPIFSVLFLVCAFFNVACSLLLFDFEFLPVSFIVIYVGAIAVLFLFILMMLNIKLAELHESNTNFIPVALIFIVTFLIEIVCVFRLELPLLNTNSQTAVYFLFDLLQITAGTWSFSDIMLANSNVKTISVTLFNGYFYCFILAGFALLLAMISAIVLTLQKRFVSNVQNVYIQILKNHDKCLVQYK